MEGELMVEEEGAVMLWKKQEKQKKTQRSLQKSWKSRKQQQAGRAGEQWKRRVVSVTQSVAVVAAAVLV